MRRCKWVYINNHLRYRWETYSSNGKCPVEVAIALNLSEPAAAAKYYREYWNLKWLNKLYSAYIELGGDSVIWYFEVIQIS